MKTSLYGITQNLAAMDHAVTEALEADVTDEVLVDIVAGQMSLEKDLAAKLESYCRFIRELESLASSRQEEAKRIASLGSITSNKATRLKAAVKEGLNRIGKTKISTPTFEIRIQKAGGKLPLVLNCSDDAIPEFFLKTVTTTTVDKEKIREAIEGGEILEFASLAERGTILVIR